MNSVNSVKKKSLRSLVALDDGPWRHPWHIAPSWSGRQWTALIKPGLVNGDDVTVQVPRNDGTPAVDDLRLSDRPRLPLTSFRSVGPDAAPTLTTDGSGNVVAQGEAVPLFFQVRGVGPPPQFTDRGGVLPARIQPDADATRLLRACDLVLYADRPGTSSQFTLGVPGESIIAQYHVTYVLPPHARALPYLRATAKYQPPPPDDPLARLIGDWSGPQRDELWMATIWLMSPRGAAPQSAPDATWQPFVHHRVFWNLHHSVRNLGTPQADLQLTLNTGLAAGTGDRLNAFLLAQANDPNTAIAQFLSRTTLEGKFWSC